MMRRSLDVADQDVERRTDRLQSDGIAVPGELVALADAITSCARGRNVDRADRIALVAASRSRIARHGDCHASARVLQRAFGEPSCHLGTYRAVRFRHRLWHTQPGRLGGLVIEHEATLEHLRCTGDRCQAARYDASGAGLRSGDTDALTTCEFERLGGAIEQCPRKHWLGSRWHSRGYDAAARRRSMVRSALGLISFTSRLMSIAVMLCVRLPI